MESQRRIIRTTTDEFDSPNNTWKTVYTVGGLTLGLILFAVLIVVCGTKLAKLKPRHQTPENTIEYLRNGDIEIFKLSDSCDYVVAHTVNGIAICHSGNCKNKIHNK